MIAVSIMFVLALILALVQSLRLDVAQDEIDDLLFELEGLTWARGGGDFDDEYDDLEAIGI